jgi:hypothetical protein
MKEIEVNDPIDIVFLGGILNCKPYELIVELVNMDIYLAPHDVIDIEIAQKLAFKHGVILN